MCSSSLWSSLSACRRLYDTTETENRQSTRQRRQTEGGAPPGPAHARTHLLLVVMVPRVQAVPLATLLDVQQHALRICGWETKSGLRYAPFRPIAGPEGLVTYLLLVVGRKQIPLSTAWVRSPWAHLRSNRLSQRSQQRLHVLSISRMSSRSAHMRYFRTKHRQWRGTAPAELTTTAAQILSPFSQQETTNHLLQMIHSAKIRTPMAVMLKLYTIGPTLSLSFVSMTRGPMTRFSQRST